MIQKKISSYWEAGPVCCSSPVGCHPRTRLQRKPASRPRHSAAESGDQRRPQAQYDVRILPTVILWKNAPLVVTDAVCVSALLCKKSSTEPQTSDFRHVLVECQELCHSPPASWDSAADLCQACGRFYRGHYVPEPFLIQPGSTCGERARPCIVGAYIQFRLVAQARRQGLCLWIAMLALS